MYSFTNDYSEGAHPRILQALVDTNLEQTTGYGEDRFSREAVTFMKEKLQRQDVDIHLLSGGTQTNMTAIAAFLRPHEAVIGTAYAHVATHETGAIESTGHKVLCVKSPDGKVRKEQVKAVLDEHSDEHMVKPKLLYLSNSTEVGTIYTKAELTELSQFCRERELYLYMDGARIGAALCAGGNDLTLHEISHLVDAFYIGGTKNGALLGEALVICRPELKSDFRFYMKQNGAMLAKGRVIGLQFSELFRDNLFFDLATQANARAEVIRRAIQQGSYTFLTDSPTNQLFPILPNALVAKLQERYEFRVWQKIDENRSAIRLVTSWATPEEAVRKIALEFV